MSKCRDRIHHVRLGTLYHQKDVMNAVLTRCLMMEGDGRDEYGPYL